MSKEMIFNINISKKKKSFFNEIWREYNINYFVTFLIFFFVSGINLKRLSYLNKNLHHKLCVLWWQKKKKRLEVHYKTFPSSSKLDFLVKIYGLHAMNLQNLNKFHHFFKVCFFIEAANGQPKKNQKSLILNTQSINMVVENICMYIQIFRYMYSNFFFY